MADGPYFIHLSDPGFPETPWPGERRLGPFPTSEEAIAQAVSDLAYGTGASVVGVYSDAESEKRREASQPVSLDRFALARGERQESKGGKAHRTRAQLERSAGPIRRRLDAERAQAIADDTAAFEDVAGMTVADLIRLSKDVGR